MKTLMLIMALGVMLALLFPGAVKAVAERAHAVLFDYMGRAGLVLFAEVNARIPTELAANRKALFDSQGKSFVAVAELPLTHAAYQIGDLIAYGIVLKKGTRLLAPVTLSNNAGTAACTLAVGLRNNLTKVAVDATAILAATAINAAQTIQANTGTKIAAGLRYVLTEDCEIYGTVAGAVLAIDQAVRLEVPYIAA
jgi:hypothetical protein